jgi:hypothetical protein
MSVIHSPRSTQLVVGSARAHRRRRARVGARTRTWPRDLRLRLTAAWRGAALDRMLAQGVDPQTSAVLALRARQLTAPRRRGRIADGLAGALRSAQDDRSGLTSAVRPDARELLGARVVLTAVERRLRGSEPVTARGVALLGLLLTDGASPLYRPSGAGELASRLRAAAAATFPSGAPLATESQTSGCRDAMRGRTQRASASAASKEAGPWIASS